MMANLKMLRTLVVAVLIPVVTLGTASDLAPEISGAETVTLPEDTTVTTDLGAITCIDKSLGAASNAGCSTCVISSVSPVFDRFTLVNIPGNPDFHLRFLPGPAAISSSTTPSYTVTLTCNGLNQVSAEWIVEVEISSAGR